MIKPISRDRFTTLGKHVKFLTCFGSAWRRCSLNPLHRGYPCSTVIMYKRVNHENDEELYAFSYH